MVFGKNKHNLTKILRFPHKDAASGNDNATYRTSRICLNPPTRFSTSATHTLDTTSLTKTTGPSGDFATLSGFQSHSLIGNASWTLGPFQSEFKIGEGGYFNLNKLGVITEILVSCKSNVISDINSIQMVQNNPPTYPKTTIDAFRLNSGGFVGFNIFKVYKEQWDKCGINQYFRDLLSNESLFKLGTYHHSEDDFKATNIVWV